MEQEPIEYPAVSIAYCVRCNWVLRASWYQQEILQTFTSKAKIPEEAIIRSVILKPSFISGTFKVFVKLHADSQWIQVWDRIDNQGFPEAKILKQQIRNVLSPDTDLGHSDKKSTVGGTLISNVSQTEPGVSRKSSIALDNSLSRSSTHNSGRPAISRAISEAETIAYGSPRLAAEHKTFCEECLDNLPPTWET